jgi:hypothetical protein
MPPACTTAFPIELKNGVHRSIKAESPPMSKIN